MAEDEKKTTKKRRAEQGPMTAKIRGEGEFLNVEDKSFSFHHAQASRLNNIAKQLAAKTRKKVQPMRRGRRFKPTATKTTQIKQRRRREQLQSTGAEEPGDEMHDNEKQPLDLIEGGGDGSSDPTSDEGRPTSYGENTSEIKAKGEEKTMTQIEEADMEADCEAETIIATSILHVPTAIRIA